MNDKYQWYRTNPDHYQQDGDYAVAHLYRIEHRPLYWRWEIKFDDTVIASDESPLPIHAGWHIAQEALSKEEANIQELIKNGTEQRRKKLAGNVMDFLRNKES